MFIDKENLFSNAQAITATAASSDVIDLDGQAVSAARKKGAIGIDLEILAQVVESFATLTSLTVALQTDDDSAFGTAETVVQTAAIATASLVVGHQFRLSSLPHRLKRYVRLLYTVAGSNATAGKVTAALVLGRQSTNAM